MPWELLLLLQAGQLCTAGVTLTEDDGCTSVYFYPLYHNFPYLCFGASSRGTSGVTNARVEPY